MVRHLGLTSWLWIWTLSFAASAQVAPCQLPADQLDALREALDGAQACVEQAWDPTEDSNWSAAQEHVDGLSLTALDEMARRHRNRLRAGETPALSSSGSAPTDWLRGEAAERELRERALANTTLRNRAAGLNRTQVTGAYQHYSHQLNPSAPTRRAQFLSNVQPGSALLVAELMAWRLESLQPSLLPPRATTCRAPVQGSTPAERAAGLVASLPLAELDRLARLHRQRVAQSRCRPREGDPAWLVGEAANRELRTRALANTTAVERAGTFTRETVLAAMTNYERRLNPHNTQLRREALSGESPDSVI